ncbi:hypothetical protein FOH38_20985 [Lysinibacillus fusiformis]|nr:hypothetical protein FOH38_20985 [Lysinibacillus fusiformis]
MRKYILMVLMSTLLLAPTAYAHTMDKTMLYTDVPATTPDLQEIMVLHSIGLIGYNGTDMALNPTENLSREDFAGWVGGFFGLEGSTVDELAQAAKNEDYVSTLEGDITYKEINTALFHNKLEFEKPDATLTKDEYISFLTENIDVDMGGHTLLQMGGFSYGPTGTIEDVVTGDETGLIIDGKTYMLSGHPRIFADSTEAESWVGQKLEQSILTTSAGHHHGHETQTTTMTAPTLQYIQLGTTTQVATEDTKQEQPIANATPRDQQQSSEAADTTSSSTSTLWMVAVGAILAVIMGIAFWKRKK